jgi:hypothetical protein
MEGSCEHGCESLGSIKCLEVLKLLHNWRLLKKELSSMELIMQKADLI